MAIIFYGFLIIVIGCILTIFPYLVWYLQIGWRIKDGEPSELALVAERVFGVILVVIGIILITTNLDLSGQSNKSYIAKFKQKLEDQQVESIHIGWDEPVIITGVELEKAVQFILEADIEPFDPGSIYGSSASGKLVFKDSQYIDLEFIGKSGFVELHPTDTERKYIINSQELVDWFKNNVSDY